MPSMKQFWILIACAVAVAFLLRWPQINESLWLDELHTAWCVSGNWGEIHQRAQIGNHSPLYFFLPRLTTQCLGLNEIALRLPSLIAGLLLVAVGGLLVWRWTESSAAAFLCAMLIAVDPVCIFYSQEARPYAWLQLCALCHLAVVAELSRSSSLRLRVAFILGALTLIYLHYTAALFVFAEAVFLVGVAYSRRSNPSFSFRNLVTDFVVIAVCCIPAVIHARAIMQHGNAWKSFVPDPSLVGLVQQSRLHTYLLWPLVGAVAAQFFESTRSKPAMQRSHSALCLVATVFVLPWVIAWCVTEMNLSQVLFRRYLLPSYVAGLALASLLCASMCCAWLRGGVAVLTVGMSLWSSGIVQHYSVDGKIHHDRQQDWRSAVQFINEHAKVDSDTVLVRGGFLEADRLIHLHSTLFEDYNLAPVNNIYRLKIKARPVPTSPENWATSLENELNSSLSSGRWIAFNGSAARREEFLSFVRQQLGARLSNTRFEFQREFGDVMVVRMSSISSTQE